MEDLLYYSKFVYQSCAYYENNDCRGIFQYQCELGVILCLGKRQADKRAHFAAMLAIEPAPNQKE